MKSSNPKVMINAYRLLVARLREEGDDWNYPIHLGVTEAGEGEDARIKSAIGIGSLLHDGIGDTIRVSLTEDSIHEIPVARALVDMIKRGGGLPDQQLEETERVSYNPFEYERRGSHRIERGGVNVGGEELIRVVVRQANYDKVAHKLDRLGDYQPEIVYEGAGIVEIDPRDDAAIARLNESATAEFVTVRDDVPMPLIAAFRLLASRIAPSHPILLKDVLVGAPRCAAREESGNLPDGDRTPQRGAPSSDFLAVLLTAATNIGSLLCDGIGDAVLIQGEEAPGQALRLSYNVLQAAGSRIFKTDYVACPSCGRTLFNLQTTTARIKAATLHLKGVKIAIMGCIVNGPGEMADADFGYVGGAPGKVNLYVGKTAVKFNIPETDAVERLQDLIREHGKWVEPAGLVPAGAVPASL
jgi:(E)-4-hydroxy-3-methylbut-2-enyl-diphosphate synthase